MKNSAFELLPTHSAAAESDDWGDACVLPFGTTTNQLSLPGHVHGVPERDWQQNTSSGSVRVALRWTHSGLTSVGEMTYITLAPPMLGWI